jgi:hypothetical protein
VQPHRRHSARLMARRACPQRHDQDCFSCTAHENRSSSGNDCCGGWSHDMDEPLGVSPQNSPSLTSSPCDQRSWQNRHPAAMKHTLHSERYRVLQTLSFQAVDEIPTAYILPCTGCMNEPVTIANSRYARALVVEGWDACGSAVESSSGRSRPITAVCWSVEYGVVRCADINHPLMFNSSLEGLIGLCS